MLVWSPALLHQGSLYVTFHQFYFYFRVDEEKEKNQESSEVEEKNHVKTEEKPLSCPRTKLKDLKKRRAKKSFICTQCGKSVSSKPSLERHMRVHTGGKPFTCDQCGKSFTQSSNLKNT